MTDASTQELLAAMPFARGCGIEIIHTSKSEVSARMAWREDLCTTNGILHGGVLMAFADTIGAVCAFLNLPEGAGTGTLASSTSFLRAVREGEVTATATPLHTGRSTIVVRTDLRDSQRKLVATTTQTQAVLGGA